MLRQKVKYFENEMKKKLKEIYEGDQESYEYQEEMEKLKKYINSDGIMVYEKEEKVVAITSVYEIKDEDEDNWIISEFEGVIYDIISLEFEFKEEFLKEIALKKPNVLIYEYNLGFYGIGNYYEMLKLESKKNEEEVIVLNDNYLVSMKTDVDLEKIIIERESKKDIKEIRVEEIDFSIESSKIKKLMEKELQVNDGSNNIKYQGFQYFTKRDLFGYNYNEPINLKYFLAIAILENEEEKIVGVLKIQDYHLNESKNYIGLNYINIHSDYRRKGIANELYNALNEHLKKRNKKEEVIFVSSIPSDMGRKIKINEIRKKKITAVRSFDDLQEYYEFKMKNS